MPSSPRLVNVSLTFRNIETTDALRTYATEKMSGCIQKFAHQDTDVHMVLKVERNRHSAEVTFHTDGHHFQCTEESVDMYASIDKLVDTVSHQLRKHKEKLTSKH